MTTIDPSRPTSPDRDRLILSKGHAAPALYATLSKRGFFSDELLATLGSDGSKVPEQMSPGCLPGIEAATGSLGHGPGIGCGYALSGRQDGETYRTYVIVGDGVLYASAAVNITENVLRAMEANFQAAGN